MSSEAGFEELFDARFELDQESLERSDEIIIGDQDVRLLMRDNRIALAMGRGTRIHPPAGESDTRYFDVPLICQIHSHPECRFRWSRLLVDLNATPGARIRDMSPREVRGDKPVEIKTSIGLGLKFETAASALSAEINPSYETSKTVYYPEIVSSGQGFAKGYWDFLSLSREYLHADRELRVLISAPDDVPTLIRFGLRAKVQMDGLAGLVPLLVRSGAIDKTYALS